jgi:hypothetical protein
MEENCKPGAWTRMKRGGPGPDRWRLGKAKNERKEFAEDAEGKEGKEGKEGDVHGRAPRTERGRKLGAEEDGFALEHFDGEEEGGGGVDAGGGEDDGDVVPVVGAGD